MIHVQNLSRFYGSFAAIQDLSFTIESNQVVGFLGLNGAGKSPLSRFRRATGSINWIDRD